jgi:hypothetical protein
VAELVAPAPDRFVAGWAHSSVCLRHAWDYMASAGAIGVNQVLAQFDITACGLLRQLDRPTPAASRDSNREESQSARGDSHAFMVKPVAAFQLDIPTVIAKVTSQ